MRGRRHLGPPSAAATRRGRPLPVNDMQIAAQHPAQDWRNYESTVLAETPWVPTGGFGIVWAEFDGSVATSLPAHSRVVGSATSQDGLMGVASSAPFWRAWISWATDR